MIRTILILTLILSGAPWESSAGGRQENTSAAHTSSDGPVTVVAADNQGGPRPAVHLIRSERDLERANLPEERREQIRRAGNLPGDLIIHLQVGTRPTGGYRLYLQNVTTSAREMTVRIGEESPAPGTIVSQALTYPAILLVVTDPPPSVVVIGPER